MAPSARADFVFDRERNVYICPGGESCRIPCGTVIDGGTLRYRASKVDCCDVCSVQDALLSQHADAICPSAICARDAPRCRPRPGLDRGLRTIASGDAKRSKMRFAHMKRIFKLDRLRLRGLSGAGNDEVLLTRNRPEPPAPRQVPLPPAAIGGSATCAT